jgi:fructoselysine-6-P-deglycase FrlB-like protein
MLKLDEKLLAANKETEILSAYVAGERIEASLRENGALLRELAAAMRRYKPDQVLFVGSGASYCTLYSGWYFLRTCSTVRAAHFFGPELVADDPPALRSGRVVAILSSYSGKTADTLAASEYLKKLKIPRIALSKDEKGPLASGCEHALVYRDKCLYTSAMANLLSLLAGFVSLRGEQAVAGELTAALARVPDQMRAAMPRAERTALEALETVKDDELFYVLGDGAVWALAYQFGYTNLMEYSRVHAACLRSCEWRHGPLEVLFRKPAMIHLLGSDSSRAGALAARDYCRANGAKVICFDSEEYFPTHPVLTPFALHPVTQAFILYQSTHRGINMDDYLEMHVKPYKPGEIYF